MGLLQKAYETYENHRRYVGVYGSESKEPLAPVAHIITSAQLEITVDRNGRFVSASMVDEKSTKIIIPATEKSAGRSGTTIAPHPLCDHLEYVSVLDEVKMATYIEQLANWTKSEYSHPMLPPILDYVKGCTVLSDLARAGINKPNKKNTVRWRVVGIEAGISECWTSSSLFDAFTRYYTAQKAQDELVLCMIRGVMDVSAQKHLAGIVSKHGRAKIISSNDSENFTYRGRFTSKEQAVTVGYEASQKAHNALKWLIASHGVSIGSRTFLCWNPRGKKLPRAGNPLLVKGKTPQVTLAAYKKELVQVLWGYRKDFDRADCAVIAVFDAANDGRLAVTYYNEIQVQDFLDRLEKWDTTCVWTHRHFGVESPSLDLIVDCTFGTPRDGKLTTDERVRKQQLQRLFICRIDGGKMPFDIMQAIVHRTMQPLAYDGNTREQTREQLNFTACAVVRKFYMDNRQEEYRMALEKDRKDVSYQYGRLLAVLEKAERDTYDSGENRDPNAIRLQSVYCSRPFQTAAMLIDQIKKGYYPKHKPGVRTYYEKLIGEIMEKISAHSDSECYAPLRETYIMGYYLQKNALYTQNTETETEEE